MPTPPAPAAGFPVADEPRRRSDPMSWSPLSGPASAVLGLLALTACNLADERPAAPPPVAEPAPAPPRPTDLVTGKAMVVTGDVLEVEGQRVRLQAVAAPDIRTTHGKRALIEMRRIISREAVRCDLVELEPPPAPPVPPPAKGPAGTKARQGWIGRCSVGTIDVAQELVKRGWARALPRYGDTYLIEEASARAAGRGMWPKPPPAKPAAKPPVPRSAKRQAG